MHSPIDIKVTFLERKIAHMVLNSLLNLHELQMKYVNTYKCNV